MNVDLTRALREATELTRANKVSQATQLLLTALTGKASSSTSDPSTDTEAELSGAETANSRPQPTEVLARPRRPLGAVLEALGRAKARGLAPNPLSPVPVSGKLPIPEGAQYLTRSFTAPSGSRSYKLYLPASGSAAGRPLVVMLHGCTQDADDFALGTGMNELAEEFGFVVAYPSQSKAGNPSRCWNWFAPKDQMRGTGEPSIIAGLTSETVAEYDLDPRRVFVAGLSAGGAMAAVMGATYPDLYAAIGVHSGLPYGAATDVVSAFSAMRGDRDERHANSIHHASPSEVRTIVFHGEADTTVHPTNGSMIVKALRHREGELKQVTSATAGGRPYRRTILTNREGVIEAESWLIGGAGHAWSGGNAMGSYADEAGPNASREMIRFFLIDEKGSASRS